jgi:nitroreductase
MDPLKIFRDRHSVRRFTDEPVPDDLILQIAEAASLAPTARNIQPWSFISVKDPARLKELSALVSPNGAFMKEATACLVVLSEDTKYYLEDGSAATTQACLCASLLGLGSCWIAGDKKEYALAVLRSLGVPESMKLISLIAIGYPAQVTPPEKKKIASLLHKERF